VFLHIASPTDGFEDEEELEEGRGWGFGPSRTI